MSPRMERFIMGPFDIWDLIMLWDFLSHSRSALGRLVAASSSLKVIIFFTHKGLIEGQTELIVSLSLFDTIKHNTGKMLKLNAKTDAL